MSSLANADPRAIIAELFSRLAIHSQYAAAIYATSQTVRKAEQMQGLIADHICMA